MAEVITIPYQPRALQEEMHKGIESHRFSVVVAHRRFGKTVATINHLIKQGVQCEQIRPRFGYVAPLYSQAKTIAWDYLKHYTEPIPGVKRNESELWVELPNESRIRLFGSDNPDALRGMYLDGAVLDEVAQMKPSVWGEIIRPALTDRQGWALFIGTPKGLNLFSELYFHALKDPQWYAGFFPVSKTRLVPEEELANAKATMSEQQYLQEFECDFSASNEDVLIPLSVVNESSVREYNEHSYIDAPITMGVDVARFGDDSSVIIMRRGVVAYDMVKLRDTDTMHLSSLVARKIDKTECVACFVDEIGVGAGVVDRLKQLGYGKIIKPVNSGSRSASESKYRNLRAQMWCDMRDWLMSGGSIPDDTELKNDLSSVTYFYDNANRICLEKKEDMKKRGLGSPDCADALALTFSYPVRVMTEIERLASTMDSNQDYDPLGSFIYGNH